MSELIFKEKLGEFYTSPTKLSNNDKEVQYLIEIGGIPLLFIIRKNKDLFYGRIINEDSKVYYYYFTNKDKNFDHTDISIIKKYSNGIFDKIRKQFYV